MHKAAEPHLSIPLGGQLVDRTTSSTKAVLPNGATVTKYLFPQTSTATTADMLIAETFKTPVDPEAQTMSVPFVKNLHGDMTSYLVPSTASLNIGWGDFDDADGEFNTPYSSILDGSSMSLPSGTKVGIKNLFLGGAVNLGTYFGSGGDGEDYLSGSKFKRHASATVGNYGAVGTIRAMSQLGNASASGGTTQGFGDGLSGTAADDTLTLLGAISIVPTVTILPPMEEGAGDMKFVIKKGSSWPGEYSIKNRATGEYVKAERGDDMKGIVSKDSLLFTEDFEFDTAKYEITEALSFTNSSGASIVLEHGTVTTLPISISVAFSASSSNSATGMVAFLAEVNSTTTPLYLYLACGTADGIASTSYTLPSGSSTSVNMPDGTDRSATPFGVPVIFSEGTEYDAPFTLRPLQNIPAGFLIANGSTTSAVSNSTSASTYVKRKVFSFGKTVLFPNFSITSDTLMTEVTLTIKQTVAEAGSKTLQPQAIPLTASWQEPLNLGTVIIANNYVAQGDMHFNVDTLLNSAVTLVRGTVMEAGSILPIGTVSREGIYATDESTFAVTTSVQSDLDLRQSITVDQLNGTSIVLPVSTILRAKSSDGSFSTRLPVNMIIPNGNVFPADIRINPTEGVALKTGLEVGGAVLGPGFIFSATTQFEPETSFPIGTTFSSGVLFPAGTEFPKDSKFGYQFPMPIDTIIARDTKIPASTKFAPGSVLPSIPAREQEDNTLTNASAPFFIVTQGSTTYMVIKNGGVFSRGYRFPKGTVLLPTQNLASCSTTSGTRTFASGAYTSGAFVVDATKTYTFDEGEFSFLAGSSGLSIQNLTLSAGTALTTGIEVKGSATFDYDVAVPFIDSSSVFENMAFDVNFITQRDATLAADMLVNGNNMVYWAANQGLPQDVVLVGEIATTASSVSTRKVTLPNSSAFYLENVLSTSGTTIQMPNIPTVMPKKFKVGSSALTIGMGSGESHSYIQIPRGTYVTMQYTESGTTTQGLKLRSQVKLEHDWEILEQINSSPSFVAAGLFLINGSSLPGTVTIGSRTPFPRGFTFATTVQLAESFEVGGKDNTTYSVPALAEFAAGSKIAKGSTFTTGCALNNVTIAAVKLNADSGAYVLQDFLLNTAIKYYFFYGTAPMSTIIDLSQALADLQNTLAVHMSQPTH